MLPEVPANWVKVTLATVPVFKTQWIDMSHIICLRELVVPDLGRVTAIQIAGTDKCWHVKETLDQLFCMMTTSQTNPYQDPFNATKFVAETGEEKDVITARLVAAAIKQKPNISTSMVFGDKGKEFNVTFSQEGGEEQIVKFSNREDQEDFVAYLETEAMFKVLQNPSPAMLEIGSNHLVFSADSVWKVMLDKLQFPKENKFK